MKTCFQEVSKEISGMKWVKNLVSKVCLATGYVSPQNCYFAKTYVSVGYHFLPVLLLPLNI